MGDGASLDRAAATRVLRRASETAGDASLVDVDVIDEQTLIAAAGEVGIPVAAVRRAIAVERLGPPPPTHVGDGIVGTATVSVDAELTGNAGAVLARIDTWMVSGHHLRRDRRRDGHGEWTKRPGAVGAGLRTVRGATGEGRLGDVRRVTATVRDTGDGTCVVRVQVDRHVDRTVRAAAGAVVGGGAAAGIVLGALAVGPMLLVVAPAALAIGVGLAATGRSRAGRVEHEVERLLDAVDQQARPARLSADVLRRIAGRPRPA
ncbi:MAG: hypothetical protein ABW328_09815 [Ilumatobacteraceae bacterium]